MLLKHVNSTELLFNYSPFSIINSKWANYSFWVMGFLLPVFCSQKDILMNRTWLSPFCYLCVVSFSLHLFGKAVMSLIKKAMITLHEMAVFNSYMVKKWPSWFAQLVNANFLFFFFFFWCIILLLIINTHTHT